MFLFPIKIDILLLFPCSSNSCHIYCSCSEAHFIFHFPMFLVPIPCTLNVIFQFPSHLFRSPCMSCCVTFSKYTMTGLFHKFHENYFLLGTSLTQIYTFLLLSVDPSSIFSSISTGAFQCIVLK